jgi:hypothetical protein
MTVPAPALDEMLDARHVIGLDIGDGESALAWAAADDLTSQVYRRPNGQQAILTALAYAREGRTQRIVIGDDALLTDGALHFSVNFKERSWFTKIQEFTEKLLEEFYAAHPDVKDRCLIFVGYPAGWDAEVTEGYRRYLEPLGPAVYLLPESQSALVHVRDLNRAGDDARRLNNVLVIDIGSSTVDITVVEDLVLQNIVTMLNLGCNQIDAELAEKTRTALGGDPEFTAALESNGGEEVLLLACRRVKEAQFSGQVPTMIDVRTSRNQNHALIVDRGFGWLKNLEIPQEVTRPGGWADKFAELLGEVKQRLARQPETVILTGGGSRMPFVRQLCRRAFPGASITPQPGRDAEPGFNPSLSVAQGLASAGCQRVRMARFRRDMRALVTAGETRAEVRTETERAFDAIRGSLIDALKSGIVVTTELLTDPPGKDGAVAAMQVSVNDYLVPRAQRICTEYGIDSSRFELSLQLPQLLAEELSARLVGAGTRMFTSSPYLVQDAVRSVAKGLAAGKVNEAGPFALLYLAAVGASEGMSWYGRRKAIAEFRQATLPPDVVEQIVANILGEIGLVIEDRASVVERFVT